MVVTFRCGLRAFVSQQLPLICQAWWGCKPRCQHARVCWERRGATNPPSPNSRCGQLPLIFNSLVKCLLQVSKVATALSRVHQPGVVGSILPPLKSSQREYGGWFSFFPKKKRKRTLHKQQAHPPLARQHWGTKQPGDPPFLPNCYEQPSALCEGRSFCDLLVGWGVTQRPYNFVSRQSCCWTPSSRNSWLFGERSRGKEKKNYVLNWDSLGFFWNHMLLQMMIFRGRL